MESEQPKPTINETSIITPEVTPPKNSRKKLLLLGGVLLLLVVAGAAGWWLSGRDKTDDSANQQNNSTTSDTSEEQIEGLQLDPSKDYGNKYADGILPVGDEQYTTSSAQKGKVYMCNANFVPDSQAGAQTRGPWFIGTTQWDLNEKYAVQGSVKWEQNITSQQSGGKRIITTNGLPDHDTGIFPVGSSDPAYQYDRNPNAIKSQSLTYDLAGSPAYGSPNCMGGEVGILLTGVPLFNAFDAGGRDAGAWEIQDACEGHPQGSGIYHYHTLSSCITDVNVSTVIGFALDGFPITGPKVGDDNFLTTDDLDECHGIVSEIILDGTKTTMYHYVMTQDFPYSVSCFRAEAIQAPGQHSGGPQQSQQNKLPPRP
jgi:hypothetical protein